MQAVTIDRDKYIGGSDIPIIMGISPFKTRFDLLLEKAGVKENEFTGNSYTEYGNVIEPKIRDYINKQLGKNFVEGKHIDGDIRCHTDGEDYTTILEIKSTSQIHVNVDDYKVYLVQLLFYMFHTGRKAGMLAVYHRPEDFNEEFDEKRLQIFTIRIENYMDLLEKINKAVEQFRIDLVKVKENPFITEDELLPTDISEMSCQVEALEIEVAQDKIKEKRLKELKEILFNEMTDRGIKKWETPNGTKFTLVESTPDKIVKKFNEKLFKENNLDLWEEYSEDVVQNGKNGYVRITLPKED